jgi:hypothetical protein
VWVDAFGKSVADAFTMTGRKPKQDEAPRGGRARSVAELLPEAGRASFRKFGFVQHSIVSRWAEIVGQRYAGVSAPESIRFPQGKRANGTLHLTVASAHAPMMQHVLPEILERVNRFFGYPAVEKVAMRQGVVAKAAPKPVQPELKPVPVELGDSLRAVGDPELRAVLESLARGIATTEAIPVIGRVKA